jgi:hypothetical protein
MQLRWCMPHPVLLREVMALLHEKQPLVGLCCGPVLTRPALTALAVCAGVCRSASGAQLPITPPSFLVMTMVAERGRTPAP